MLKRTGFSLIELLVVVAIIGILAGVGLFAYQSYISSARDGVTSNRLNTIDRTIDNDLVSIRNNLNTRSGAASNESGNKIIAESICENYRDALIREMNSPTNSNDKAQTNPFNNRRFACDGNAVSDYYLSENPSWNHIFTVDRGSSVVYCQNPGEAINSSGFGLLTCACTGPEPCNTEPRPKTNSSLTLVADNGTAQDMNGSNPAWGAGTGISELRLSAASLVYGAVNTSRLDAAETAGQSGKIVFVVNGNPSKQQEFVFGLVVKDGGNYRFQPSGSNALSYDNVTQADNATVYINDGGSVCWTPPPRLINGSGNPTLQDKRAVHCMSQIDIDHDTAVDADLDGDDDWSVAVF